MTTQAEQEKAKDGKPNIGPFAQVFGSEYNKTTALDWAVFGCLAAGGVGIYKAVCMDTPVGVLLCLLGSVAAFGLIIFVHLRKD